MPDQAKPSAIYFFANGMAMTFDDGGNQLPQYQGKHAEAVAALKSDGIDWHQIATVYGNPWPEERSRQWLEHDPVAYGLATE